MKNRLIQSQFLIAILGSVFTSFILAGGVATSRYLLDGYALNAMIDIQTSIAFFTFVCQAGLRAGFRKYYIEHSKSTAVFATGRLVQLINPTHILIVVFLSLILSLCLGFYFSILTFVVGAYLTLIIGMGSLTHNFKSVIQSAFLLIGLYFLIVTLVFVFSGKNILIVLVSELLSLAAIVVLQTSQRKFNPKHKALIKIAVRDVFLKYMGLQINSFIIMGFYFALSRYVLLTLDSEVVFIYADLLIIAGIFTMLMGRLTVFFERAALKNNKIEIVVVTTLLLALTLSGLYVLIKSPRSSHDLLILSAFSIILLGKFPWSYISSVIVEKKRKEFILVSSLPFGVLITSSYIQFCNTISLSLWALINIFFSYLFFAILVLYVNRRTNKKILLGRAGK